MELIGFKFDETKIVVMLKSIKKIYTNEGKPMKKGYFWKK
jgi:hypothetical protein